MWTILFLKIKRSTSPKYANQANLSNTLAQILWFKKKYHRKIR